MVSFYRLYMKSKWLYLILFLNSVQFATAQLPQSWSEADRQFLLSNMKQSRDELVKETAGLTAAQWNFKESPDRWSISQITEHIAFWELILQREISVGLNIGPRSDWASITEPDSVFIGFIFEEKKHLSNDYTWPFTFSQPMGLNTGETNLAWFLKMRKEGIDYLTTAKEDLRKCFVASKSSNVHQRFITTYGHCARHVRQIQKVKQHSSYPRK